MFKVADLVSLIVVLIVCKNEEDPFKIESTRITLVNVNAPVVATTSWWLHFSAPVVA